MVTAQDAEMPPDDVFEAMCAAVSKRHPDFVFWHDDMKAALSCPAYQSYLGSRDGEGTNSEMVQEALNQISGMVTQCPECKTRYKIKMTVLPDAATALQEGK